MHVRCPHGSRVASTCFDLFGSICSSCILISSHPYPLTGVLEHRVALWAILHSPNISSRHQSQLGFHLSFTWARHWASRNPSGPLGFSSDGSLHACQHDANETPVLSRY
jgi:hypothetical protein